MLERSEHSAASLSAEDHRRAASTAAAGSAGMTEALTATRAVGTEGYSIEMLAEARPATTSGNHLKPSSVNLVTF